MGKNNRKRRAFKQAKKKKKKKPYITKNNKKSESLKFQQLEDPLRGLTGEKRKEAVALISKNCEERSHKTLIQIKETISEYDPFIILSILASYALFAGVGDKGIQRKDSDYHLYQYHLEFLQALILQLNEKEINHKPCGPEVIQVLWDALPEHMQTHNFMNMSDDTNELTDDEKAVKFIQYTIRLNTKSVRNWGYFSQVINITSELYSHFTDDLKKKYGFNFEDLIIFFQTLMDVIAEKNNQRVNQLLTLRKIKDPCKLVYAYYEMICQSKDDANNFIDKYDVNNKEAESIFFFLMSHNDILLPDMYSFSISDECFNQAGLSVRTVQKISNQFSINLGGLENNNADFFYLSNPVWLKPIINIDSEKFFCVMPQVFFSFIIPILEGLIEPIVGDKLSNRRAEYLEGKVEEIICRRFTKANTVSGCKWHQNGREYETDLIVFIDSHALIVEVKSGKITEPALRGATKRIKKHIEEIFIEPNLQSKRLKEKLLELIANPNQEDELRQKLPVDLNNIEKVIRVSVSYEDFSAIQTNIKQLSETGWLPDDFEACPTMNIADFETLFDYLEHPVQILHYLERRQYIEESIGYMADELDLMGLYTETLFNMGEINPEMQFNFIGMSDPIDKYYNSKDAGVIIEKPKPKISPLFSKIFNQLERRYPPRWTEIGIFLSHFSPEDQIKLAKMVKSFEKKVQKNWRSKSLRNIIINNPPKSSNLALAYVVYNDKISAKRDDYIDVASRKGLEPEHVEQCIVIAKNIDDDSLSYHFIGLFH